MAVRTIENAEKYWWYQPEDSLELDAWGWALVNRGYVKSEGGDFYGSKDDYLSALYIFNELNCSNANVVNYVYHPLANLYTRLDENEEAIRLLEVFVRLNESMGNGHFVGLGYNDLGLAYRYQGNTEEAMNCLRKGMLVDNISDQSYSLLMSNAASLCLETGNLSEGIRFARTSIRRFETIESTSRTESYLAGAYLSLGALESKGGNFKAAEDAFRQSAAILTRRFPEKKHRKWGKFYLAVGDMFMKQSLPEKALEQYQLALQTVLPDFHPSFEADLPDEKQLYPEVVIIESLLKKAEAYELLAKRKPVLAKKYLMHAHEHYAFYFSIEGVFRREHLDDQSKLNFAGKVHQKGERAIAVVMELFEKTKEEKWLKQAILFTEHTKGIILSESLLSHTRGTKSGFPEDLGDFIRLKGQKEQLEAAIRKESANGNEELLKFFKRRLQDLSQEIATRDQQIRKKYPEMHQQLYASNRFELADFQSVRQNLKKDIITYYFGADYVYGFCITKKELSSFRLRISAEVLKDISDFRSLVSQPGINNFKQFKSASSSCYAHFFKPFEEKLTSNAIIVIPDGPLAEMPFEAMCSKGGNSFKSLNYLLTDYSIHYAYSIKRLARSYQEEEYASNFLGFAPQFTDSKHYAELSYSQQELSAGKELGGMNLMGEKATKSAFIEKAEGYRIVHLSTHASMWNEAFHQATIATAEVGKPAENHVFASELSSMGLSPELIVLSACETGYGRYSGGEGMLSLSRIFAQTGSQNIVGSLWKVNHASNSKIITGFYRELTETSGIGPSEALTLSKRRYLDAPEVDDLGAHPYYWSGMVLIGNDQLHLSESRSYTLWILAGGLLLVIGLIFLYLQRKGSL